MAEEKLLSPKLDILSSERDGPSGARALGVFAYSQKEEIRNDDEVSNDSKTDPWGGTIAVGKELHC